VEYVPGEYVRLVANDDYFKASTIAKQGRMIATLEEELAQATEASEETARDIAALSEQINQLTTTTSQLESQISSLETEVSNLEGGLTSASNISYASIAIALVVGAVAIYMARRET